MQTLESTLENGIDPGLFRRVKNAGYGQAVRALTSLPGLCFSLAAGHFRGCNTLEGFEVLQDTTAEQTLSFLRAKPVLLPLPHPPLPLRPSAWTS